MLLKLIHIINICSLLLSISGIMTYQHFCQDKLKSFSFFSDFTTSCCEKNNFKPTKDCTNTEPEFNQKKCCEDKTVFNTNNSPQEPITIVSFISVFWSIGMPSTTPVFFYTDTAFVSFDEKFYFYSYKAPPNRPLLHILFSSFRC